jgi:hypothetical protein
MPRRNGESRVQTLAATKRRHLYNINNVTIGGVLIACMGGESEEAAALDRSISPAARCECRPGDM